MITLYQFPISHYCEKARWALDYKHVDHKVKNLLPGIHVKTTKKLAPRSSVPVLVHDNKAIQGSNHIISYLDEVHKTITTSVATPISYPTNMMVYGPGGYRFMDFIRFGVPLTIIIWLMCVFLIPMIWPFNS